MIAGIVLIATGVKHVVAHVEGSAHGAIWLLAGGVALYLLGDVSFRWVIGIRPVLVRVVGAVVALLLAIIGSQWNGVSQLGTPGALLIVLLTIEQRLERGSGEICV